MKRPEGCLRRLPCFSLATTSYRAYTECQTLAQLADWYDRTMPSSRRMSGDELGSLVERVSSLRARDRAARSKRAAEKKADEFAEFFYGRDHRNFGAIRGRQIAIKEARCDEVPRHTVWTLGSRLWCLRVPKESTATASTHTLKLMELGGQLIRGSLGSTEHAEPLILAFAQGVVLGFSLLANIDITNALEGLDFWRRCELASIYDVGVDRGQRLRSMDDRDRSR
ncbi:hypothetical protein V9K97_25595 [Variovorax sp. CCNWLW186]|uniref:hypothetical protein n=1 Tax=Variovorax sp. CCNWLW186 TaxID=3127473 RepID=UPI0030772555